MPRLLRKASKIWDGGYAIAGAVGNGDAVMRDPNGIRPAFYLIMRISLVLPRKSTLDDDCLSLKKRRFQKFLQGMWFQLKILVN